MLNNTKEIYHTKVGDLFSIDPEKVNDYSTISKSGSSGVVDCKPTEFQDRVLIVTRITNSSIYFDTYPNVRQSLFRINDLAMLVDYVDEFWLKTYVVHNHQFSGKPEGHYIQVIASTNSSILDGPTSIHKVLNILSSQEPST